tara:strand:- start:20262 stop:20462 length:201 start_codon:yes stop_codon:yes gene_type:complete
VQSIRYRARFFLAQLLPSLRLQRLCLTLNVIKMADVLQCLPSELALVCGMKIKEPASSMGLIKSTG